MKRIVGSFLGVCAFGGFIVVVVVVTWPTNWQRTTQAPYDIGKGACITNELFGQVQAKDVAITVAEIYVATDLARQTHYRAVVRLDELGPHGLPQTEDELPAVALNGASVWKSIKWRSGSARPATGDQPPTVRVAGYDTVPPRIDVLDLPLQEGEPTIASAEIDPHLTPTGVIVCELTITRK